MMPQRPNNPYATGRTPTGQPILTLEDRKRMEAESAEAQRQYDEQMAAQAAAQNQQPFPGTAPQMESPGLLAQALDYAQRGFRWGQENLGGQLRGGVAPENNPTADGPGVGKGGRAREEELRRQEEEAVSGKRRR